MTDDRVTAARERLYRLSPTDFVAERTALARAARTAGDALAGNAIAALARPTQAAWVVNLLTREDPELVDDLVELGTALREAQAELDGATLRQLSDRRRAVVQQLTQRAFELSGESHPAAARREQVQATLSAAVLDPDIAATVRSGVLLRAAQASGFGPADLDGPPPVSVSAVRRRPPATRPQVARQGDARRPPAATRIREVAHQAVAAAEQAHATALAAERDQDQEVRILTEQLAEARRRAGDRGLAVRHAKAVLERAERELRAAP